MVLRTQATRHVSRSLKAQSYAIPSARRGLAAPASGSFQYETGEAQGVKYASRDQAGPTTTLALVARAGTRYQPLPGLAEGLEKYAFRNTHRRSALRLQREAELLGGTLFSHHTRENVVIGAKFFRDDLAYFAEVLNEVACDTKYLDYEFTEGVMTLIHMSQREQLRTPARLGMASVHSLAFHRGLGEPLHPTSSTPLTTYLSHDAIGAYSTLAYRKPNVAIVANGADASELGKWVGEFFGSMRTEPAQGVPALVQEQTKYYGGEERIAHASSNAMTIAFPGSSSVTGPFYKPEIAVLGHVLGGVSSIKWTPGFSLLGNIAAKHAGVKINTKSLIYSDAGLLTITITGPASGIREAATESVAAINDIANGKLEKEAFKKAVAQAKFDELEYGQELMAGIELTGTGLVHDGKPYQIDETAKKIDGVTEDQVKKAAKDLLTFKASVSTVGDLFQLPFADEVGLKV